MSRLEWQGSFSSCRNTKNRSHNTTEQRGRETTARGQTRVMLETRHRSSFLQHRSCAPLRRSWTSCIFRRGRTRSTPPSWGFPAVPKRHRGRLQHAGVRYFSGRGLTNILASTSRHLSFRRCQFRLHGVGQKPYIVPICNPNVTPFETVFNRCSFQEAAARSSRRMTEPWHFSAPCKMQGEKHPMPSSVAP